MRKFLHAWLESLEINDAELRAQGYTIIYGPDICYLTPLPRPEEPAGRRSELSMVTGLWTNIWGHRRHTPSKKARLSNKRRSVPD